MIPAIRAQMGTHTYYAGAMSAADVCQQVGVASELDDWHDMTIEEVYQRDLNRRRVEQEIAPYLVNTPDRFFGSIIVLVRDPSSIAFEPLEHLGITAPAGIRAAAQNVGVLTIGLGQRAAGSGALVALDGQHRLASLRAVVQGGAVRGPYEGDVGDDTVTVLFVEHQSDVESRRLFTTLNRSARKVSKNDLLLMGEDDARNIVGRALAQGHLLAPRGLDKEPLVKWDGNTIKERDTAMTTLNALNDMVEVVAAHMQLPFAVADDYSVRPSREHIDRLEAEAQRWLLALFSTFPELEALRDDPASVPAARAFDQPVSMLLKPAGLVVFMKSVALGADQQRGNLGDIAESMADLRKVGWSLSDDHWQDLMVTKRGTISGRRNEWDLAADVVTCIAGGSRVNVSFRSKVELRYGAHIGRPGSSLPLGRAQ
jgi:DNA sulfur modification protein DndB